MKRFREKWVNTELEDVLTNFFKPLSKIHHQLSLKLAPPGPDDGIQKKSEFKNSIEKPDIYHTIFLSLADDVTRGAGQQKFAAAEFLTRSYKSSHHLATEIYWHEFSFGYNCLSL